MIAAYLKANFLLACLAGYIVFSAVLKAISGIDVCIPCLWHRFFSFRCPGCGLTTAFVSLLKLDFAGAWAANPLIFVVLPAGLFYLTADFLRFRRNRSVSPPASS